jgi:TRAP-type C4-dicarboxylate transport system substrate-binding protein
MKNKILLVLLALTLVALPLWAACAPEEVTPPPPTSPAKPEPTVIKAISWLPVDFVYSDTLLLYAEQVKLRSNGQLIIDVIGDGEVIPTEEQIFAVKEGRIDMIFSCGDDISQAWPLGFAMVLTGMKPWEEREAGIWDFYRETLARDCNVYWLGQLMAPMWWNLFTNVRAEHPEDLKGLKIRCGATFFGSVEAIGAVPVSTAMSEIYTAMERGMVDGFVFPPSGWTQFGWQEVTKYWVGPRLLASQNCTPLINLDKWNSLTKEEQNLLTQTVIDMEKVVWAYTWWEWAGDEYGEGAIVNAGVERIEWTDEENKSFQETWREALWDYVEGQVKPDDFARFEKLVGR